MLLFISSNEGMVQDDDLIVIMNIFCGIPNYCKSLLKRSTNVAGILLIFCKLISLYIDVHFVLTFGFPWRASLN